jgi:hypothetical protein
MPWFSSFNNWSASWKGMLVIIYTQYKIIKHVIMIADYKLLITSTIICKIY